jgi:hypothetical protein
MEQVLDRHGKMGFYNISRGNLAVRPLPVGAGGRGATDIAAT